MSNVESLKNDRQARLNALCDQMEPEGRYPLWEKMAAPVLPKPTTQPGCTNDRMTMRAII